MIDVNPNHLETVKRILAVHVPDCEVRAFGSRVNWTAKDYSDLDLAVVCDRALDADLLRRLREEFEKSDLPFRVDALDWHSINDAFQKVIEKKCEVIQKGAKKCLGIAGEWTVRPLEDCMAAIIDYRGKTPQKTAFGIPLITAKVVKDGRIETPDEFIASEDYDAWMRRGMPKAGDVVMTTEAPLGEVAQLGEERVALAQRLIGLRGKPDTLDNRFLKFLMQSADVQEQLRARASGTTVLGIKQSELRKVLLTLPHIAEQRKIAHILGTLDAKTELNRQMSDTLEAMARALFKSWFVDFDPVRAKAEGRDPGLPQSMADLFPDSFDDSEIGEIPKGWLLGALGDVADHPRRTVQPKEIESSTPYIALEHMPRRCIALSDWGSADGLESNKFEFKSGEILFGKLRPYFHKVGVAPVDGVCSTDIVVVTPREKAWFGFVLGHLSSDAFVEYTSAGSTGTKMPRTSWSEMARYRVAIPNKAVGEAFTYHVRHVLDRIVALIHESRMLVALRDSLLPKLVSGNLRLADQVAAASTL